MSIIVEEVISINGIKITIRIFEESSKDTLYHLGNKYKGVAIREYVSIQRGFRDIICIIEGEYLDENKKESSGGKTYYIRKVDAKPIGYFDNGQFNEGIKFLPMIKDPVHLIKEESLSCIYSNNSSTNFVIGEMLKEEIPISLPWQKIFNTHIGIFGNTGSGKSNTLTALFTTLFESKANHLDGKSKFIVLDFNGEYTGSQLLQDKRKQVLSINTQTEDGDKFPLYENEFWDTETLSIL